MQNALQKVLQVHFLPAGFPMQIHFCISKNLGSARVGMSQNAHTIGAYDTIALQKEIFASSH